MFYHSTMDSSFQAHLHNLTPNYICSNTYDISTSFQLTRSDLHLTEYAAVEGKKNKQKNRHDGQWQTMMSWFGWLLPRQRREHYCRFYTKCETNKNCIWGLITHFWNSKQWNYSFKPSTALPITQAVMLDWSVWTVKYEWPLLSKTPAGLTVCLSYSTPSYRPHSLFIFCCSHPLLSSQFENAAFQKFLIGFHLCQN